MKLSEEMKNKTLLSFELFPPKTEKGLQNLPGTIDHLMKYNPSYISCTYGAGGGNVGRNREVCQEIIKAGTTPVTHFTVIKNTKEGIKQQLEQYLAEGVDHMLALRGDIPKTSKLGNTMSRYIYTVLTGHYFRDNQSGLRGFSAAQLPWLCAVPGEKYDYELNMLLYADKQRIPVTTLPIDTVYIDDNASSHFDALHDTVRIYKLLFSQSYPRFLGIALSCLSALALSFFVKGAPYGIAAFCAVLLGGLLEVLLCRFAAFSAVHYRDGWACLLRAALRGGALGGFCALLLWRFPALFPFAAFLLGGALLLPVRYLFHKATRMLPRKPR